MNTTWEDSVFGSVANIEHASTTGNVGLSPANQTIQAQGAGG